MSGGNNSSAGANNNNSNNNNMKSLIPLPMAVSNFHELFLDLASTSE